MNVGARHHEFVKDLRELNIPKATLAYLDMLKSTPLKLSM